MKLADVKKLSGPIWFLIVGTMIAKASYFVSMPYLALRLQESLHLDPLKIGMALGIGPFAGIFAGFYIGHLSDHWGRKWIFTLAILSWSLAFLGFAFATELWQFAALNTLSGLCSAAFHPVSAALISDLTPAPLRQTAYQLRYFAINLGATVGPSAGAWLLLRGPGLGFLVAAGAYGLFAIACAIRLPPDGRGRVSEEASFAQTMAAIARDRPLFFYTLAFVLMGLTYSQLESTLPQFLHSTQGDMGVRIFGLLMGVNAATVVLMQIPMTRLTSGLGLLRTLKVGSCLYGLGYLLFAFIGRDAWTYGIAMAVLTLGEILIFANGNLVIDQIAPEKNKGAYFGASGLWALGPTVGPALGGWLMMKTSGSLMFGVAGILGVANVGIYALGGRAQARTLKRSRA